MNYFRRLRIYLRYKKQVKKALKEISNKYFFSMNTFGDFYTVLDLSDTPDRVRQEYGRYWKQNEINNFLLEIQNEMDVYNIHEELGVVEIIRLADECFGISFGIKRSIFNPINYFLFKTLFVILTIIISLIIII